MPGDWQAPTREKFGRVREPPIGANIQSVLFGALGAGIHRGSELDLGGGPQGRGVVDACIVFRSFVRVGSNLRCSDRRGPLIAGAVLQVGERVRGLHEPGHHPPLRSE